MRDVYNAKLHCAQCTVQLYSVSALVSPSASCYTAHRMLFDVCDFLFPGCISASGPPSGKTAGFPYWQTKFSLLLCHHKSAIADNSASSSVSSSFFVRMPPFIREPLQPGTFGWRQASNDATVCRLCFSVSYENRMCKVIRKAAVGFRLQRPAQVFVHSRVATVHPQNDRLFMITA